MWNNRKTFGENTPCRAYCHMYAWRKLWVLDRMIEFISTSVTFSLIHTQYSAIADLHTLQFTVAHAIGFSVLTSRILATDLNTGTNISNHYEVFLPLLVQSPWNIGTQLKLFLATSELVLYSCGTDNAENTVLLLCSADHTENTIHVIAKHCWVVTPLRLRGSLFTGPLPRSGLYCCVLVLLRNGYFCGSTVLAWSKYATMQLEFYKFMALPTLLYKRKLEN
jgi:hypothetical protein